MKKAQRDTISTTDDFEDLTLFANESFDTQDVDLFEFTSEESSPLTRLKSIILSLDWEINDEILQELADELDHLQSMWLGDKVAEVYLQGLSKIGIYIRTKGAYAHPNSIKLLLTFFYNFEKIISSQNITGEQITQLLKGDVRKFKILQYQINQSEQTAVTALEDTAEPISVPEQPIAPLEESSPTKQLKAAILSLDWEVTDESLTQYNNTLTSAHQLMLDNKPALVLLQGLQALGDYIADERAEAHPESFTLLHSFHEALEQITAPEGQPLEQTDIQDLLVDRINRLNNLKMLISTPASMDEQLIEEVVEEISAPVSVDSSPKPGRPGDGRAPVEPDLFKVEEEEKHELPPVAVAGTTEDLAAEIDTLFAMEAKPAMETADLQYPDEILPPDAIHPVEDELADDFIEAHLSTKRGLMPALSDTEEFSGFNEATVPLDLPAQSDLAEQLDFLFAEAEDTDASALSSPASSMDSLAIEIDDHEPVAALADVELDLELDTLDLAHGETEQQDEQLTLAIEDRDQDQNVLEIHQKLDSFFADAVEEPARPAPTETTVEAIEQSLFFDEEQAIPAALADSDEERGFSEEEAVASMDSTPIDEIEAKLDFFFGADTEEEPEPQVTAEAGLVLEEIAREEEFEIAPALSGVSLEVPEEQEEPAAVVASVAGERAEADLQGALDLFFDSEEEATAPVSTATDELTEALEATLSGDQVLPEEGRQMQLADLGALLPIIVRTPSRDKVAEAMAKITALQQLPLSSEQRALVQLLNSVVTLLMRLPTRDSKGTEKLVNYLYEQLLAQSCPPEMLPKAINRYTNWLQQASTIMPLIPEAMVGAEGDTAQEPQFAYTAKELYFELSELRLHIKEEFAKLRHELHHHKG